MFYDRQDAGRRLGWALEKYKEQEVLVLAIPRGGVEVGYYVAEYLQSELSLVVSRKLPYPGNPEFGFGAIAEDGSTYILEHVATGLSKDLIEQILAEQKQVIKKRIKALRQDNPLPNISGRTVILVDDGIAMGSTMQAAARLVRNKKAAKLVIASPVSDSGKPLEFREIADEVIILETPDNFFAVAQVYENWRDITDEEVAALLQKYKYGNK